MRVGGFPFVLAADDQYRPASGLEERAKAFDQARYFAHTQNQHLPGSLAELACELTGYIAKAKLSSHLQTVNGLSFGARVQQSTHAMRTLG